MSARLSASQADWLTACRRASQGLAEMLAGHPTTVQRAVETGRGEGGDQALVIDRAAEEVIFSELDRLHAEGHRFWALSEERGEVDYGNRDVRVVIDPIDGSMNAKRGLTHHAVSIAVADGPTMGDVMFGFVHDFGAREEWWAARGAGAHLNGTRLGPAPGERRVSDGRLELVAIESADPRWVAAAAEDLQLVAHRLRAIGSIAISLCQVAQTRVDGMATLWRCRSVDAAAAQLIVRETGGLVRFTAFEDPLGAPLDLEPHSAVIAARTTRALEQLARLPAGADVRRRPLTAPNA
jgi:myo-inositol-1(or 4)-monophosphatase